MPFGILVAFIVKPFPWSSPALTPSVSFVRTSPSRETQQPFPVCGVATGLTREMLDQQEALISQASSSSSPHPRGDICFPASRQELPAPPRARPQPSTLWPVSMGMASPEPHMAPQGLSMASFYEHAVALVQLLGTLEW